MHVLSGDNCIWLCMSLYILISLLVAFVWCVCVCVCVCVGGGGGGGMWVGGGGGAGCGVCGMCVCMCVCVCVGGGGGGGDIDNAFVIFGQGKSRLVAMSYIRGGNIWGDFCKHKNDNTCVLLLLRQYWWDAELGPF